MELWAVEPEEREPEVREEEEEDDEDDEEDVGADVLTLPTFTFAALPSRVTRISMSLIFDGLATSELGALERLPRLAPAAAGLSCLCAAGVETSQCFVFFLHFAGRVPVGLLKRSSTLPAPPSECPKTTGTLVARPSFERRSDVLWVGLSGLGEARLRDLRLRVSGLCEARLRDSRLRAPSRLSSLPWRLLESSLVSFGGERGSSRRSAESRLRRRLLSGLLLRAEPEPLLLRLRRPLCSSLVSSLARSALRLRGVDFEPGFDRLHDLDLLRDHERDRDRDRDRCVRCGSVRRGSDCAAGIHGPQGPCRGCC